MRKARTALAALACLVSAHAAALEYTMTCDEVLARGDLEITAEARERFRELQGSCMGVVEQDGRLYMHTEMVVRRVSGNTVVLYLPATDHTFEVRPAFNDRITVGNSRVRVRDLSRGQRLNLYVPVDAITQPVIREIAFEVEEVIIVEIVTPVSALPTTG